MRVDATLCKNVAGLENLSVRNFDSGTIRDQISLGVSCLLVRNDDLTFFLCIFNCNNTTEFSDDRKSLRASGLEKLLDTRKTLCDIAAGNTAGVECTHGQLCTRLTDGLCGNDTNSLSDLYRLACRHVCAVALGADTDMALTCQDCTDLNSISAELLKNLDNGCGTFRRTHMVCLDNNFSGIRICDRLSDISACQSLLESLDGLFTVRKALDLHVRDRSLAFTAVCLTDDKVLGYVNKTSCQVTGVGCTKSGIGHTFSRTMCGDEVLKYVKTFTEVGLDREFDRVTGRIRHESSHTGKLLDLLIGTTGSGVRHHEDVVVFIKTCQKVMCQLVIGCFPYIDNFFVTLFLCDKTTAEVLSDTVNGSFCVCEKLLLCCRDSHIGNGYGHSCSCGVLVTDRLDIVQGDRCLDRSVCIDDFLEDLL